MWRARPGSTIYACGLPAQGLSAERLPADVDVVGRLAFPDGFEFLFQLQRCKPTPIRAGFAVVAAGALKADPIAQVCVDEFVEAGGIQFVVVDQSREAVFAAIPDVPEERTVVEQSAVLGKEIIPQPLLEALARRAGCRQQGAAMAAGSQPSVVWAVLLWRVCFWHWAREVSSRARRPSRFHWR